LYGVYPRAAASPAAQFPNVKPEVPEKYDGKTHPSEFLSIYTIAVQAAGARDDKILAN
jgi:hypothetical protein